MSDTTQQILSRAIGPAPWYWQTFPSLNSNSGQRFIWRNHGDAGELAYLITLALEQEPNRPRLALNTYCRPFFIPPGNLGIWCPEGRNLRFACFDPDTLKKFDYMEIVGWFKQSGERIFSATEPAAEFEVPVTLEAGTHKIEVPQEFRVVDELLIPTSYPAKTKDDAAMAIFIVYPQAGLVEVLPQKWITANTHDLGSNWVPRLTRHPVTHRIVGELTRVGMFELSEDGKEFGRWL